MAFPVGWLRQCKLTVQHTQVSADQTAFPVLITEACLPSEMLTSGGANAAQSDGGDIRFSTDAAGSNQLACEIVGWTQNATPALATAEIWVPVSVLAATNVDIYVWYSAGGGLSQPAANTAFGSQSVWNSNFKAVWHLGSTLTPESTSNGNTLTNNGATTTSGKIGGGAAFNGSSQSMSSSSTVNLSGGRAATVEYWINSSSFAGSPVLFETSSNFNSNTGALIQDPNGEAGSKWGFEVHGFGAYNGVTLNAKPSTGAWHHIAMVVDTSVGSGQAVTVYIDGSSAAVTQNNIGDLSATNLGNFTAFLMSRNNASLFQIGSLDEFRISSTANSSTWISTGYNSQSSPSSFLVAGTPTSVGTTNLTQSVSDTESISDTITGAYGLLPSDTNTLSDKFVGGFGISPAETLTFSDGSTSNYGLIPSDTETFSDSVSLFIASSTLTQTVSDTVNLSDSQGGNFGLLPNEAISFSDTLSPVVNWKVSLSESSTNYSDLVGYSLVLIQPDTQPFFSPSDATRIWTDSQLIQWASDGLGQIAQDVACVWQRESIAVQAGVSVITLPKYVRTVRRVTWRGRTLDPVSFEELQMLSPATNFVSIGNSANIETSNSKPLYYAMHPTNPWDIRLYPSPNESFSANSVDPYSPTINEHGCCVDYYRQPDDTNAIYQVPIYILRRTVKAYVLWKAYGAEGKGQDLKASKYYKFKYEFLIERFRSINDGCFVGKKYSIEDGLLATDGFRYPRPMLNPNFERVRY